MTNTPANNSLTQIFAKDSIADETDIPDAKDAAKAPSWFHHKDSDEIGRAMSARYMEQKVEQTPAIETAKPEAYEEFKRKMDDRFVQAQRLYDTELPRVQRPTLPLKDIHGRRRLYQEEQRSFASEQRQKAPTKTPWLKMASLKK